MSDTIKSDRVGRDQVESFAWLEEFVRLTGEDGDVIVRRGFVEAVVPGRGEWAGGTIIYLGNGRPVRVHEKPAVVFDRIMGE